MTTGAGGLTVRLLVLLAVLLVVGVWAYQTAHRLDRLHVRYDLSWQALDSALARRAVVARAVAVDAYGAGPEGKRLAALAGAAEQTRESRQGGSPKTNCRRRSRSSTRCLCRWRSSPNRPTRRRA